MLEAPVRRMTANISHMEGQNTIIITEKISRMKNWNIIIIILTENTCAKLKYNQTIILPTEILTKKHTLHGKVKQSHLCPHRHSRFWTHLDHTSTYRHNRFEPTWATQLPTQTQQVWTHLGHISTYRHNRIEPTWATQLPTQTQQLLNPSGPHNYPHRHNRFEPIWATP